MKTRYFAILFFALLCAGCGQTSVSPSAPSADVKTVPSPSVTQKSKLVAPISSPFSRITKKPFGIYITKQNSPVRPEKFSGYHTGVDFETFDEEKDADVPVFAVCDGKLLEKKIATGYGGVAVQSCKIDAVNVTIICGHLKLDSISLKVGDDVKTGQQIGILGKGYSAETSGERKHLHFGVHKGSTINILGYVQKQSDLNNWLDAEKYLR